MKKIELAVFDMAGTTVNENNIVYKTVQKVINDEGYSISLEEVLQHGAGKEKQQAIMDVLTNCTTVENVKELAAKMFANFKPSLEKAYDEMEINSFDGVDVFIQKLRNNNIKVVLNTGYDAKTTATLLNKLNWQAGRDIDAVVNADDVEKGRPHPDMIEKAMELTGINNAENVLKAGDSEIDILEGKNAGCGITVGVLSGAQTKEQLQAAQPDYILSNLTDLEEILLR